MESFVWCSCLLPELWSLNLKNYVLIAIFCWYEQNSKADIAIYIYVSESSCFAFLENDIGYYAMT